MSPLSIRRLQGYFENPLVQAAVNTVWEDTVRPVKVRSLLLYVPSRPSEKTPFTQSALERWLLTV